MKSIREMSNLELRRAIVSERPCPWSNVRMERGRLVGDIPGIMSELPDEVPNWPGDIGEALKLEDGLRVLDFRDQYTLPQ